MNSTFRYDPLRGNAADTYALTGILGFDYQGVVGVSRIITLVVWDANALVMLSFDGVEWGDEFRLDMGHSPIQWPPAVRNVQIMNETPGAVSDYQIIGFW